MKLDELLSTSYKYETQDEDDTTRVAEFTTEDGSKIIMKFGYWESPEYWEIDFRRDDKIELTGGGDAPRILGTVVKILQEFLRDEKPKFFGFSANKKEASRVSVYKRIMKRILPSSGYVDAANRLDQLDHKIAPGFLKNKIKAFPSGEQMMFARKDMFL